MKVGEFIFKFIKIFTILILLKPLTPAVSLSQSADFSHTFVLELHVPEVLNFQMNEIFFLNSILSKNIVLNTNKNKYYNIF